MGIQNKVLLIGLGVTLFGAHIFAAPSNLVGGILDSVNSMTSSYGIDTKSTETDPNDTSISNEDEYTITEPTTHSGNLILSNIEMVSISDVLYVYGDLTLNNIDSFTISGKLRVTGKLTVNNTIIQLAGGRAYFGSKKLANGSIKGKGMKIMPELTKIDPLLKIDLSEEEWSDVVATANDTKKEYSKLVKELAQARKLETDNKAIITKILANRANFFNDISNFVGDDDQDLLDKLERSDLALTKRLLRIK